MIEIGLTIGEDVAPEPIPDQAQFLEWTRNALSGERETGIVDIRVVSAAEMRALNDRYRGRDEPTNVLSFPTDIPPEIDLPLLGDLALCAEVIATQAREQEKPVRDHWAHMVTHGILHLVGYDHDEPAQAAVMEGMEKEILGRIGVSDPYRD